MKLLDLAGQRFGSLVALELAGMTKNRNAIWKCKCDCGNVITVSQSNLRRAQKGYPTSCGCLKRRHGKDQFTTHGLSKENGKESRLYRIWSDMKRRCLNPTRGEFPQYGGRGIGLYPEWMNYEAFHKWAMANGYAKNLTLDRRDNDGNYEPSNCRWISLKAQQYNKRDNHLLTHAGQSKTMTEWAEEKGIRVGTLWQRLQDGWSVEKALMTPVLKGGGHEND